MPVFLAGGQCWRLSVIKVLIVDDSAFMRASLARMLSGDPEIEVVGMARNGEDGLEKVEQLNPDLITLDIEMPRMDGLTMLEHLMKTRPKPVLMVSSVTTEGAEATLRALELGALDYIPKYHDGGGSIEGLESDLKNKIKAVARRGRFMHPASLPHRETARPSFSPPPPRQAAVKGEATAQLPPVRRTGHPGRDIVAIGVSTGGPPAVQKVLSSLPADFPACILIAQHMPATFTGAFASRLDSVCRITVAEAKSGDKVAPGTAYVCPGGKHIRLDMRGPLPCITITPDPETALYKPSATVLMESAGQSMGRRVVGVTMTGMGSDGVDGTKVLKQKGGYIIAQSEPTCVVYGMPKAVVDGGLADEITNLDNLADTIHNALYR
jgi:two-component system chemotaxis response regulator CheB